MFINCVVHTLVYYYNILLISQIFFLTLTLLGNKIKFSHEYIKSTYGAFSTLAHARSLFLLGEMVSAADGGSWTRGCTYEFIELLFFDHQQESYHSKPLLFQREKMLCFTVFLHPTNLNLNHFLDTKRGIRILYILPPHTSLLHT